jgi:putative ABC transport system permease protein
MLQIALKSVWGRKRRLLGTFVAVFAGVAFLSGSLLLGDTLKANFDQLFEEANAGTDAVVRGAVEVESQSEFERAPILASVLDRVRGAEGVAVAEPYVEGYGQLIGKDGEGIGGNGPPRIAASWIQTPELNAYRLVEGRAPRRPGEVVVNRGAAEDGDLALGDTTTVQTPQPVKVRIVGIATFGTEDGFGQTTYTAFAFADAQRQVLKRPDRISSVRVEAAPGVSQEELVRRLQPLLPSGVEAITGEQLTEENADDISGDFLGALRAFLLVFSGVAVLVATFSIHNTLSIVVAQRTRESALLRAVGASRGQLLGSVALEATAVGLAASLAGLVGGVAIASGLKAVFDAFGGALPDGGLRFTGVNAVVSLVVGVLAMLLAGVSPAVKASRTPPLAALRETALERTSAGRARAIAGAALMAAGIALVLLAVAGVGGVGAAAAGAALTVLGMTVIGPLVARPVSRVVGLPLARLRGVTGAMARQNAMRNPRRVSGSAAALTIGVAVVTLITLFASSLRASVQESVSGSFAGDLAVTTPGFGGGGLDPRLASEVRTLPEVRQAVGLGQGAALVDGVSRTPSVADPRQLTALVDADVSAGSLTGLGEHELAVSRRTADDEGWRVGTRVPMTFADDARGTFRIGAIYEARDVLGDYFLTRAAWAPHAVQDLDSVVFIELEPGATPPAGQAAVERITRAQGDPDVRTRSEYIESRTTGINIMLGLVYVMLLLAIVIALMGIANTLSLSIHERTRELGLLRAVGAARAQVRSMIRWESVIVAVFGSIGGLLLGAFLGWAVVRAAAQDDRLDTFSAPIGQLLAILLIGAVVGVLASLRPARRAARIDIRSALASE